MVRVSATAKAGSSTLNSLRTAAVIVSGFVVVRITIDAVGKVDCQNGREACGRGFSSRLALRMSSTTPTRSEEHTSELQSRLHLVCRLLLEKKKNTQTVDNTEDTDRGRGRDHRRRRADRLSQHGDPQTAIHQQDLSRHQQRAVSSRRDLCND